MMNTCALGHGVTWSAFFETKPSPAIVRLAAKGGEHGPPAGVIVMAFGGRGGRILGGVTERALHGTRRPRMAIGQAAARAPIYTVHAARVAKE